MTRTKATPKPKGAPPRKPQGTTHIHWVWVALAVGLLFGGTSGYFIGHAGSNGNGLVVDSYGRMVGHPHYGHNHP